MPDAELVDWFCDGSCLEIQGEATVLRCRSADHATVARDLQGLLVDALRDLGLPDALEIRSPAEVDQAATNHAPVEQGSDRDEVLATTTVLGSDQAGATARGADREPIASVEVEHTRGATGGADHAPGAPVAEPPTGQRAQLVPPAAPLVNHATVQHREAAQRPIIHPQPLAARSRQLASPSPPCHPRRPPWSPWRAL
jgi:hypothetical protein